MPDLTIREFVDKLNSSIAEIEQTRVDNGLKIVLDAIALVKRRVINTGRDADGGKFGNYSRAVVPFWYYLGKETNRNNRSAVNDLLETFGYFASYRDWREVNNLQTSYINFSFTNRFWNSLRPHLKLRSKGRALFEIRPATNNEREKLEYQNARFGNILALSAHEKRIIQLTNEKRIRDILQKNQIL